MSSDPQAIDLAYVALERENEQLRLTIKGDSVANQARIAQLEGDLARYRAAVGSMSSDPMERVESVPVARPLLDSMQDEIHQLRDDLARYREAVGRVVGAWEFYALSDEMANWQAKQALSRAMNVLKGLCKGTQTSEVRLLGL